MDFQLEPRTDAGRTFVELAEKHAAEAAARIAEHDRDSTFPVEVIDSMKQSGFLKATIDPSFGGGGLRSAHDVMVGLSRLARADGGLAIAVNMHLTVGYVVNRDWHGAIESGNDELRDSMATFGGLIGGGMIVMANVTEPGTHVTHPLTEVTKVDGGWSITGRKIFGTLSPVADIFIVGVRERRDDGHDLGGFCVVFRGTPGQTINDDWDALGMRSSGSGSITYENCVVPEELRLAPSPWGAENANSLIIGCAGNIGLTGAMLGIAEGAAEHVIELAKTRKKGHEGRVVGDRRGVQHAVAELQALLSTSRALLGRAGVVIDEWLCERSVAEVSMEDLHRVNAEFQTAKLVSNRAAVDAVDKALQISGGAGYMASSPLSRAYRDVRAGPFMQIYSPNEAYEYIGKVTLGLEPTVDI